MSPTRRTLLEQLGSIAVALPIAGCSESHPNPTNKPVNSPTAQTESPPARSSTLTEPPSETATPHALQCGPGPLPDAGWPQAQRGQSNASYVADGSTRDGPPSEAWSADATIPPDMDQHDASFSQPVVAGDMIYAVSRVQFGTNVEDPGGHTLQARDRSTGELAWSYRLPERPPPPAISGEVVLLPSGGTVYALNRHDGTERWSRSLDAHGRVVPGGDRLYVWGEKLSALAPDGTTIWERSVGEGVSEPPAVGPDGVYVGLSAGNVAALDSDTGETRWTAETPRGTNESAAFSPNVYTILATDCSVVVVTDGDIVAFDQSGEFGWHVEGYYFRLATDGTTLYGRDRTGDHLQTVLRARDAATGELRWERRDEVVSAAHGVLTERTLYVPVDDELIALNPREGRKRWGATPATKRLAFADGTIFGTRDDGSLVALR